VYRKRFKNYLKSSSNYADRERETIKRSEPRERTSCSPCLVMEPRAKLVGALFCFPCKKCRSFPRVIDHDLQAPAGMVEFLIGFTCIEQSPTRMISTISRCRSLYFYCNFFFFLLTSLIMNGLCIIFFYNIYIRFCFYPILFYATSIFIS